MLRVLDAFDDKNEVVAKVELSGIQRIVPWSQVDASVTTDSGLWKLEDLARVELTPPTGFAGSAALCGDPSTNGSLLFAGKLFERRDDAQWWSWSSGASGSAAPSELLLQQGECEGPDDVEWMTAADGSLWRVEPTLVSRPIKFESMKAAAVTTGPALGRDVMLGVIDGEELWVGPDAWQRWTFPNGAPAHLTAAGGFLWLTSGAAVLRFDGVTWTEVQLASAPNGSAEGLFAYDGGVWIAQNGSVCHVSATPTVRVTGIRPFLRSKDLDYGFSLAASDAGETLTATLDGEPLALSVDASTGVTTGSARLDQPGWHEITATAGSASPQHLAQALAGRGAELGHGHRADLPKALRRLPHHGPGTRRAGARSRTKPGPFEPSSSKRASSTPRTCLRQRTEAPIGVTPRCRSSPNGWQEEWHHETIRRRPRGAGNSWRYRCFRPAAPTAQTAQKSDRPAEPRTASRRAGIRPAPPASATWMRYSSLIPTHRK